LAYYFDHNALFDAGEVMSVQHETFEDNNAKTMAGITVLVIREMVVSKESSFTIFIITVRIREPKHGNEMISDATSPPTMVIQNKSSVTGRELRLRGSYVPLLYGYQKKPPGPAP